LLKLRENVQKTNETGHFALELELFVVKYGPEY